MNPFLLKDPRPKEFPEYLSGDLVYSEYYKEYVIIIREVDNSFDYLALILAGPDDRLIGEVEQYCIKHSRLIGRL